MSEAKTYQEVQSRIAVSGFVNQWVYGMSLSRADRTYYI
jgi:hypothetical protein